MVKNITNYGALKKVEICIESSVKKIDTAIWVIVKRTTTSLEEEKDDFDDLLYTPLKKPIKENFQKLEGCIFHFIITKGDHNLVGSS